MDSNDRSRSRTNGTLMAVVLGLALLPILITPFPPSTDLPQHLAQIRLFKEALMDPAGPYVINLTGPNNLVYILIAALWPVVPAAWLARAVLSAIVILWLAAIYGLGPRRGGPLEPAILASVLVFNVSFYWGFVNFLIGFPVFILWFRWTTSDQDESSRRIFFKLALASLLLYGSHPLWFAFGAVWLVVAGFLKKWPLRSWASRFASLIPCGLLSLLWYPRLALSRAGAGLDILPHWSTLDHRMLSLVNGAFGGARPPLGALSFLILYLWAAVAVWQNRKRLRRHLDKDRLAVTALLTAVALLAPDKFMNTIFFDARWIAPALVFLLLSLPIPSFWRLRPKWITIVFIGFFFTLTAFNWRQYAKQDLTGFEECLASLPSSPRVLGLDLLKDSDFVGGRPFLQLFAYAQVFKGGELNFSFAEHYSGLVSFRTKRDIFWTKSLEWHGQEVQKADFGHFDFVIVNGDEGDHRVLSGYPEIRALTKSGKWRLYEVRTETPAFSRVSGDGRQATSPPGRPT